MAGIQISGLLSNAAFDWKSIVDQLVAASGIPIKKLEAEKTVNADKVTALDTLKTGLTALQDSLQSIRSQSVFAARAVSSDVSGTTWKSNSANGAAVGSYKFAITQLATAATLRGTTDIASGLSATSDVNGVTLATMRTATSVSAGTFSVNGKQVTIALTDSLKGVFDKIAAATDGTVTAAYDPTADGVTLTSSTGSLVLGAGNDTSNFLAVMKLANGNTASASSSAALGTLKTSLPLANSGLKAVAGITAVDEFGTGQFTVNGVAISYNVNTDSMNDLLGRINNAGAGVVASYNAASDRMVFTNSKTGDIGLGLSETGDGVLKAFGLAPEDATLTRGKNALFSLNDGAVISSASNTLDATAHGVSGLSVTVNSLTTQTVSIESDTAAMRTALDDFVDKFNTVQDLIDEDTKISVVGAKVTTSILSDNREVQTWARQLRALAFDAVSGLSGSVKRIDHLGMDFDSVTGHLRVKDEDKLASALADHPDDVHAFFLTPSTGIVSKMFTFLTNTITADGTQQGNLTKASAAIDVQIALLQTRLDTERETLTSAFIKMLDAQSAAKSQGDALTNAFFKKNNSDD